MAEAILIALIIIVGTFGEMCASRAMKSIGEVKDFSPSSILHVANLAARSSWMWLGIGMMAIGFFALLGAFSIANVSFVVPVTALSYLAGACGGIFFLGESVSVERWIGIVLVVVGVTLVILG